MRRFSLHRRKGTFCAQLFNEATGRYMAARAAGEATRNEALLVVSHWMDQGWPSGRGSRAKPRPIAGAVAFDVLLSQIRTATLEADQAARLTKGHAGCRTFKQAMALFRTARGFQLDDRCTLAALQELGRGGRR